MKLTSMIGVMRTTLTATSAGPLTSQISLGKFMHTEMTSRSEWEPSGGGNEGKRLRKLRGTVGRVLDWSNGSLTSQSRDTLQHPTLPSSHVHKYECIIHIHLFFLICTNSCTL